MAEAPQNVVRAVETLIQGSELHITVRKEFDSGNVHQDWAQSIQVLHPEVYSKVIFDLSTCGLLSSTFFAGLIQLHQYYTKLGVPPLILDRPDPRVVRNLQALRLDTFFNIIPR